MHLVINCAQRRPRDAKTSEVMLLVLHYITTVVSISILSPTVRLLPFRNSLDYGRVLESKATAAAPRPGACPRLTRTIVTASHWVTFCRLGAKSGGG